MAATAPHTAALSILMLTCASTLMYSSVALTSMGWDGVCMVEWCATQVSVGQRVRGGQSIGARRLTYQHEGITITIPFLAACQTTLMSTTNIFA